MLGNKKYTTIGLLVLLIVTLIGVAIYMTFSLTATPEPVRTTQKVKAEGETFNKVVVLNTTPTGTASNAANGVSPTISSSPLTQSTGAPNATPTEIILAYKNPTVTGGVLSGTPVVTGGVSGTISPIPSSSLSGTVVPSVTKIQSLPQTGLITNSLFIVVAATTLIFVAFIF